jgi:uncharacterized protein YkwD
MKHARVVPLGRWVALLAAVATLLAPATPAHAVDRSSEAQIRNRIEELINRARANHGLRRLKVNDRTQRYATDHAQDMARKGTIFHDAALPLEVLLGATSWGENVGYTTADRAARKLHVMFMHSPGHRANILRPRFTHMGIGVEKRNGTVYVVERFADAT